jgi:hypothetical protein
MKTQIKNLFGNESMWDTLSNLAGEMYGKRINKTSNKSNKFPGTG